MSRRTTQRHVTLVTQPQQPNIAEMVQAEVQRALAPRVPVASSLPMLPPGAAYRPIQNSPSPLTPIQPQWGAWTPQGQYPGGNLQGNNSTPISAYAPETIQGGASGPSATTAYSVPSIFPPGDPIRPIPGLPVRQYPFPVGTNITPTPRGTESIGFESLRNLAEAYYGVGLCKRAFFRIMQRLELNFMPKPELVGGDDTSTAATSDKWMTPARKMRDWFLGGPSRNGQDDLAAWMKAVINDLLEIDACGIWLEPTRSGTLYALRYIAGDTLQFLDDDTGTIPRPPAPAYRQVLYGAPARLFVVPTGDGRVDGNQLDYLKMVTRTNSLYGKPPLEEMILQVNQALRKGVFDLRRFTDGSTPMGIISTHQPELFTIPPDTVLEYERLWNSILAGNDAQRQQTKWLMPGWEFTNTRDSQIALEFDQWLLTICLSMHGMTKDEVGITDTSNRAVGSSQEAVTYRNAIKPTADYFARYFTRIAERHDGQPLSPVNATISLPGSPVVSKDGVWDKRYLAHWTGIEEQDDWAKKASTYGMLVQRGIVGPSKAARQLGIPATPDEPEIGPFIIAQGGAQSIAFLDDLADQKDKIAAANSASLDASIASSKQTKKAMESGGMMGQNMLGGQGNPVAAQALAAGKPQAAQQAAQGGKAPQGQQQGTQGTVAQKAATQQVGAKVTGAQTQAAKNTPSAKRAADEREEGEDYDDADTLFVERQWDGDAVYHDATRTALGDGISDERDDGVGAALDFAGDLVGAGAAGAASGGAAFRGAGRAGGARGSAGEIDAGLPGVAGRASRDGVGRGAGAPGGRDAARSDSSSTDARRVPVGARAAERARRSAGSGYAARADDDGRGPAPRAADGESDRERATLASGSTDRSTQTIGQREAQAPNDTGGTSGSHRNAPESQQGDQGAGSAQEWRRWRDRALAKIREGKRIAPFESVRIPADLHAWVSTRLAECRTADEVRQVFADARSREERAAETPAQAGANHHGVMVAFLVPPDVSRQLAVPGGVSPSDHHITVAYLGDKADYTPQQLDKLKKSVAGFAEDEQMLPDARITHVGTFPTDPETGQYPVIAHVDAPALHAFRDRLMNRLEGDGFAPSRTFPDYKPHITLTYLPEGQPAPAVSVPQVAIPLKVVTLAVGDDHSHTVVGNEQYGNQLEGAARAQIVEPTPDPFARFLDALSARMEAQTAQVRAEQAEYLRQLRTDVLGTLSA